MGVLGRVSSSGMTEAVILLNFHINISFCGSVPYLCGVMHGRAAELERSTPAARWVFLLPASDAGCAAPTRAAAVLHTQPALHHVSDERVKRFCVRTAGFTEPVDVCFRGGGRRSPG